MTGRIRGLYETLITDALDACLRTAGPGVGRQKLRAAEASDRLALHLALVVERQAIGERVTRRWPFTEKMLKDAARRWLTRVKLPDDTETSEHS